MLTGKTVLGVGWSIATRLGTRLIDFVTLLVIARFLTPADFGIVALATSLIVIAETVLEIALIAVLTRLPAVERPHLDTAFTLGLIRGLVLAAILLAAAWPFALAYHDPRLFPLIAALTIAPVARGLTNPGMVKYVRAMSFRELFVVTTAGKVVAAVAAIAVVLTGGGYWALVAGSIGAAVGSTVFSYFYAPYRPRLSLSESRYFLTFLGWFSLSQLASAVNWQMDRIMLGAFGDKSQLGRYSVATELAVVPGNILLGPAMQPLSAAFSTIQEDGARLRGAYLKATRFAMMLTMPALVALAVGAPQVMDVLFDERWREAAPYLQWISVSLLLTAFPATFQALAFTTNKLHLVFRLNMLELVLRLVLMPLALIYGGVLGMIAARGVISVITFLACALMVRRMMGVSVAEQMSNLWQSALGCILLAAVMIGAGNLIAPLGLHSFVELATIGALGCLAYLLAMMMFGVPILRLVLRRS
jgi:PST family polysaccharide transporter